MASTYSNLKIQLMATGENSGTWGNVTNDNLGVALEEAIVGSADVTFASGNVTLTLTDTNASQTARNLRLNLVGTTGGTRDLIVPAIEKVYIVNNGCADTITVKNNSGTGIAVPAGKTMYVYNNGTNVLDAITHLTSLTLATALPPGSGGTGITTVGTAGNVLTSNGTAWVSQVAASTTNANAITTGILSAGVGGTGANTLTSENVIIGNGTSAVKFVAPGTTGNVLTSNGSAWTSAAAGSGGGDYIMAAYTSPATWTKPAGLKAVKVTVVGAGGNGGASSTPGTTACSGSGGGGAGGTAIRYIDAPAIPGPVSVTAGPGTNSFGPFASATAGSAGGGGNVSNPPIPPQNPFGGNGGNGGAGSSGTVNITGQAGNAGESSGGTGGASTLGGGGAGGLGKRGPTPSPGNPGSSGGVYGGGGGGGGNKAADPCTPATNGTGGTGAAGIVIVEEFY
jgi:hypothetical protein